LDCSGEPLFESTTTQLGYDSCFSDGSASWFLTLQDNKLVQMSFLGPDCDPSYPFSQHEYLIGQCMVFNSPERADHSLLSQAGVGLFSLRNDFARSGAMATSFLILANVNDSYVSPQPPTVPNPDYPVPVPVMYECDSADNCTYDGTPATVWTTDFEEVNCTNPISSTATGNYTFGTCYRTPQELYGATYFEYSCGSEHSLVAKFFYGNGCEHHFLTQIQNLGCGPSVRRALFCTAPPPSDPTVPSPATSLGLSVTLVLLVSLAFLSLY
jgi:hypothetical protein